MKRPTIPSLAEAAGVSVSTVNRIIGGSESVRPATRERVLRAAEEIGFYGLGTIEASVRLGRETHRLGVLLLEGGRSFYRDLGDAITSAANQHRDANIDLRLEYLDDMSPDHIGARIIGLGRQCQALALVAPQHALVADAVDEVLSAGVPVVAMIGPLSANGNVSFVGLDNWKVGRTAAWAFDKMVRDPGKIGILVGNHRFRNQEMNESGFRSYFREHNDAFTLLEPLSTYESAAVAREQVERLFAEHPDLCGLFVSGGGITGAVSALRDTKRRSDFVAVGYELFDLTRAALIDGTLTMVISHPMEKFAHQTVETLIKAKKSGPNSGAHRVALGFEIHTSESV